MKIKIIHPTRGRKNIALQTASRWMQMAERPFDIDYYFSVDNDDADKWASDIVILPRPYNLSAIEKHLCVLKHDNKSAIEAINWAASLIHVGTNGNENYLLVIISDDFDCQSNWDTKLLNHIKGRTDFCAKTIDGIQPTLITLPIMDRIYYERFGYVYHPAYQHMFCDQEMTAVAIMTGKYLKFPILFEHMHYSVGKAAKDAISLKNDATWQQGETLFNERLKTNFGIENPVVPYESIVWK